MKVTLKTILSTVVIGATALAFAQPALAHRHAYHGKKYRCNKKSCKRKKQCRLKYKHVYKDGYSMYPHWYAGFGIGLSRTHDKSGSAVKTDNSGVGHTVRAGYQYNRMWGGEAGFIEYGDSRDISGTTLSGRTEHYSVYAAATARHPLRYGFDGVGKLGVAYSYARKNAWPTNTSNSARSASAFFGAGISYAVSKTVDATLDWSRVLGNDSTGTTDLYALGLNVALV